MADEHEMQHGDHSSCGPGYASPQEAMKAEQEKTLYTGWPLWRHRHPGA